MQHQGTIQHHVNQELTGGIAVTDEGNDPAERKAFDDLVERIKATQYEKAPTTELERVARAVKLVAEETVRAYERARLLEEAAKQKMQVANVAEAVGEVISVHRRHPFFRRVFGRA